MKTTVVTARHRCRGIPTEVAERVRTTMTDEFGNKLTVSENTTSGNPCRHCVRLTLPGERMILFAYRPFDTRGPYAEIGPVFVHAQACEAYDCREFPADFLARPLTLRAYDAAGSIVHAEVAPPHGSSVVLGRLFAVESVEFVHARNPSWGCYDFRIER